ncbi:purine-binding chemotaxis protein CheW [Devosia lucknowensis]|uniref:Purine-binding chemotaxis protein CheW n=1 Tax=Devosia lucknowensis TaxID=1096929 RepID=A0A1Y6EY67_9HYPH|nr:chemotaxis protein CheW [Devosia lucknowensis]SMQ66201.1 purine-binding chemotaxis protein CheW [Devosia lucknowensis]
MAALEMEVDTFDTPPGTDPETRQFITFSCAGQNFGIDIMAMREIRNWSPVTPLPAQKPDVLGVIDIRGRVVPIHDLALRIGCAAVVQEQREGQVILVLKVDGHDMGLLVDSVSDIIDVKAEDMLAVPQVEGSSARFLAGIARQGDTLVAILDAETVRSQSADSTDSANDAEAGDFVFLDEIAV